MSNAELSVDPTAYGQQWAADYDKSGDEHPDTTAAAVAVLQQLADSGPVLEVAAGTGRIAIPLSLRGIAVTATDASPHMLDQLRTKPGSEHVRTLLDVLPDINDEDRYSLILIMVNSIWVMQSADDQLAFLRSASAHLEPDGLLVVEMGVVDTANLGISRDGVDGRGNYRMMNSWNPSTQNVHYVFEFVSGVAPARREVHLRFLRPDELLAMGASASLEPRFIWRDWHKAPFTADSDWMIVGFAATSTRAA